MIVYILLFVVVLAIIIYSTVSGRSSYQVLLNAKNTVQRQKIYRSWIIESWVLFGIPSVIGLTIIAITGGGWNLPSVPDPVRDVTVAASIGIILVLVFFIAHSWWYAGKITPAKKKEMADLVAQSGSGSLIAQNHKERTLAAWLSLAAGVNEELFFRLLIPVLLIHSLGADWSVLIVILSIVLFGVAHAYQGPMGVILSSLVGAALLAIYMATGSIILVIAIHVLFDFRATVALSWLLSKKRSL